VEVPRGVCSGIRAYLGGSDGANAPRFAPELPMGHSALAEQLSDGGIWDFRRGRADRRRLRESGLREERPTNRKASTSALRATGSQRGACSRACPSPCAPPPTLLQQALHMRLGPCSARLPVCVPERVSRAGALPRAALGREWPAAVDRGPGGTTGSRIVV
jgi:hypothetical protein